MMLHLWWAPRWERIRLDGRMDAKAWNGEPGAMPYDREWDPDEDEAAEWDYNPSGIDQAVTIEVEGPDITIHGVLKPSRDQT